MDKNAGANYAQIEESVRLIWNLTYNAESLDFKEFHLAWGVWEKIFDNLQPSLGISTDLKGQWIKKQRMKIYVKKVFGCIEKRDSRELNLVLEDYVQKFGSVNVLGMMRFISACGLPVMGFFPRFYQEIKRISTKTRCGNSSDINR